MADLFHRRVQIAVIGLSIALSSTAQNPKADSLYAALAKPQSDTTRFQTMRRLASDWLHVNGQFDSVLAIAARALPIYDRLPQAEKQAMLRSRLKFHEYVGFSLHQTGGNDSALVCFQDGARLAEANGLPVEVAGFYMYMAQVFGMMNDDASVGRYARMALGILEPLGPGHDLALTHYVLARHHVHQERWDSAEHFAKRSLAQFQADGDGMQQIGAETMLLQIYHRTRQLDSAEIHLRRAERLAKELEYQPSFAILHGMKSRIQLFRGQYADALASIDSSIAISTRLGTPFDKSEAYRIRSVALAALGRLDEAFSASDSLEASMLDEMGLDKQREIAEARMSFEQEKERALADAALKKERAQKWAAAGIGALAVLLAWVWFRSYKAKSRANEEIRRAQAQLIASEKAREAEQVRTRIARDIHDEIGASLTKIALLSGVATQKSQDPAELGKTFARISEHTRNVSRALSDVVWAVDPQRDTHQGMLEHVRDLSQRLLGDNGIRFELVLHADSPQGIIAPALKRDLHLVLNECFNNILKYAHAKLVTVRLELHTQDFELRVDDDGVGFDPAAVPDRGNGLRNMPARIAQHGGKLVVTSAPGKGTALHARGPLA
jgi:signal transduction histidine kinase